jgi:transposase-like protein
MFRVPSISGLFKWPQFEPEVILLAVGWYLRFSLSYRDVEELLAERGLHADHVTVWRWVQRYADDCQKELEEYQNRDIGVLQSGKFDEDEHYYLDTESIFGFVYEIGNNGKIRPPERRLG